MLKNLKLRWKALWKEVRSNKKTYAVYITLNVLVILVMCIELFLQNYESLFTCCMTLVLLLLPSCLQMEWKIQLPITLEVIILCFIFAAEILGEVCNFYQLYTHWDTILHTLNGFLCAAVGFSMITIMNSSEKLEFQLSPKFVCAVAFCFSMMVGAVWEIFEFALDRFNGTDCQKDTIVEEVRTTYFDENKLLVLNDIKGITIEYANGETYYIDGYLDIGLVDTMEDLIVNLIGAGSFCILGYVYLTNDRKNAGKWVARFVPVKKTEENDYLEIVLKNEADS